MKYWILPAFASFILWGLWGFIPKITTRYISPKSAMIYEVLGGIIVATVILYLIRFRPDTHPKGVALALITGILGFVGALCFLYAVSKGPVSLVATVSALYPIVVIILACIFLHEPISFKQGIGISLALGSIVLITI